LRPPAQASRVVNERGFPVENRDFRHRCIQAGCCYIFKFGCGRTLFIECDQARLIRRAVAV
jgi:hypothetical protein